MDNERAARRAARNQTRRLLWQWGMTLERIRKLEQERAEFRAMADDARRTLRSPNMSGMPRGGKSSDLSDVVVNVLRETDMYEEQVQRINTEIDSAIKLRNCIEDCVTQLPPVQERVLTYRYVDGRSWRFIAMKMNYAEEYVKDIDARAVDAVAGMIEIQTAHG